MSTKTKISLVSLAFLLFTVILAGLFYLANAKEAISLTLSYVAGLSMIFLPCTLPLVFIIVPLTMGRKPKKGLIMAILFGLGISLTLSFYGIFMALVGQYLGLDKATRFMFILAGIAALVFGVSELGLLEWSIPGFSGAVPAVIQRQSEYIRTFLLGGFLGNAGVGCPNPAFYVLLGYIATVGDIGTGWFLGFVHGLGRATPLIFLAVLGILGVNATGFLTAKKDTVDRIMGWALVFVGDFILVYGLFGMNWWEDSVFHSSWNDMIMQVSPALAESETHPVAKGVFVAPFWAGWLLFSLISIGTLIWAWLKEKIKLNTATIWSTIFIFLSFLAITGVIVASHTHGIDDGHEKNQIQEVNHNDK